MAASRVGQDTLLIIDPSDLSKKYAKKMEYLATVHDGSAHDLAQGYWTLHIAGCGVDSDGIIPLYQRLWSADAPGFTSENDEIFARDRCGGGPRGPPRPVAHGPRLPQTLEY